MYSFYILIIVPLLFSFPVPPLQVPSPGVLTPSIQRMEAPSGVASMLRSLLCLELGFMQGDNYGYPWILSASSHTLWLGSIVEDLVKIMPSFYSTYVYFRLLYEKSSICMCVDLRLGIQFNIIYQYVCFCANPIKFYNYSFVLDHEIGNGKTFISSFSIQNCF